MTIQLEPISISNSQLFKVNVYDTDGVTPLTPSGCVCDVWNKDTNAHVITNDNGAVGAGFAQYNWAGNATAGHYEALLTVTVSVGVVKSEHFLIEVQAKPPALTLAVSENLGRLRRMTAELTPKNYSDADMTAFLEACPVVDENGESPRVPNSTTNNLETNPDWTPTYDLHAAAALIWEDKAALVVGLYDFEADGGSYSRGQMHAHMMQMARYHQSRRNPKTITLVPDLARERTNEVA